MSGPDPGRSPSVRSRCSKPGCRCFSSRLLCKEFQKARRPAQSAPPSKVLYRLPTAALSASGKGSKRSLPLSLSAPLLFQLRIPPEGNFVKGTQSRRKPPAVRCSVDLAFSVLNHGTLRRILLLTTPPLAVYNTPKAMTERDGSLSPPESRRAVQVGGTDSQVLWLLSRMFEGAFRRAG